MDSQLLLQINTLIVIFLIIYFVSRRPKYGQAPKLNLRTPTDSKRPAQQGPSAINQNEPHTPAFQRVEPTVKSTLLVPEDLNEPQKAEPIKKTYENYERDVTPPSSKVALQGIYFVYNGHEWECHEVLGLSLACSIQEATIMYQDLIKKSDSSTFEFYESAYNALLQKKGSQKKGPPK